jgi:hypothetical protein
MSSISITGLLDNAGQYATLSLMVNTLLIIDPQNDFCDKKGALSVPEPKRIAPDFPP